MKRRRSLLFGLGILTALSVTVPTSAAQVQKEVTGSADMVETQETETDVVNKEDTQNQESTENGTGTEETQTQKKPMCQMKDGVYQVMVWNEEKADYVKATSTGVFELELEGETGAHTYFLKEGKIQSGLQKVKVTEFSKKDELLESKLEEGSYFFYDNGGKEDAPRYLSHPEKESWLYDKSQGWYYVYPDGKVELEKKNGWQEYEAGKWIYVENGLGNIWTGWVKKAEDQWWYLKEDGSRLAGADKQGIQTISYEGKEMTYFLDADGKLQKGFQTADGKTYYFDEKNGELQKYTGWKTIGGKTYYFNDSFQLEKINTNGWQKIENQWYWMENGEVATGWKAIKGKWYYMEPSTGIMQTGFFKDSSGRLYHSNESGAMTGGGWNLIHGTWYWMHDNGVIQQGWLKRGNTWYYLDENTGAMKTGWYQVKGKWYYSDGSGAMQTGWILPNGRTWYYLTGSGAMAEGWQKIGNTWYYLTPGNGAMKTGWYQVKGKWYYSAGSGAMQTGWIRPNGRTWYYMTGSGAMAEGWQNLGGTWYYLTPGNGAMQTGWIRPDGKTWYYLRGNGAMAANTWVDTYYYVNGSGAMVSNTWVGNYYVGADGRWIPNYDPVAYGGKWEKSGSKWYFRTADGAYLKNRWQKLSGKWYHFDASGVMATGWKYLDGYKYYFNSDGALVQDLDSVIGIQPSYEITVNRAKCQVTVYAKDGGNGYIIPVKTFACSVGLPETPTPTGTFYTPIKYRWHTLMGPSYGQYCTRVVGGVLFHSVAGSNMSSYNLSAAEYNKLGQPASHGCIRLTVRDAKWIYDNCKLGTKVTISDTAATPFDKPSTPKIPASQNWDPTDPNV